jgi:hypothetical protein
VLHGCCAQKHFVETSAAFWIMMELREMVA